MNTIERIEARRTITCHRSGAVDELLVMVVQPDEWAAIKAVVESAVLVNEDATVIGERSLGLLRDLGEALSKLEN